MSQERIIITFDTVNDGNFKVIDKAKIAGANQRVKDAMKEVVRTYEKKESQSQQAASKLVLNA